MRCHEGPHDPDNPHVDPATGEACFGCRIGSGTGAVFALGRDAMPSRVKDRRHKHRPMREPSWEKGIATFDRPDGTKGALLGPSLSPIGIKEGGERRHEIQNQLSALRSDPNVLSRKD